MLIIILLILIIIIMGIIFWKYVRQVKDICRQLAFLKEHESNMLITRELDLGGIRALTDALNDLLKERKADKKAWLDKERMISDTYTNLSHDIRTPLTSLDGYFQLLSESTEPEVQERYIQIIRERIDSLKTMLDELFTFTRLKNDAYVLELTPCYLNHVLGSTVLSYYEEWKKLGIEPDLNIGEHPVRIWGNTAALRRVIQNVIKNGLDHGRKEMRISLTTDGGTAVLIFMNRVENPQDLDPDRVFDRFYKADEARSRTSTGLGLSIAREFVVRMHGSIRAFMEGDWFGIEIRLGLISGSAH